ncbi:hypothetical protein GCM10009557_11120 [Virgisporangium ochraceum]
MTVEEGRVDCCIVGCGPAGAMLGLILARAGIDVVVLEKHQDFFRDFRGDVIHPPTLHVLDELGLIDRYFELPVERELAIKIVTNEGLLPLTDYANPKAKYPYVTYVPQWDFLSMLTEEAKRYPTFRLLMQAEGVDLLTRGDSVRGVRYRTPDGVHELAARLTVAADGRRSRMRDSAGLVPRDFGAPMDLLWFRVRRTRRTRSYAWRRATCSPWSNAGRTGRPVTSCRKAPTGSYASTRSTPSARSCGTRCRSSGRGWTRSGRGSRSASSRSR